MIKKLDSGHTYKDYHLFHKYGIIDGPLYPAENHTFVASFYCIDIQNDKTIEQFCDLWITHLIDATYFAIVLSDSESLVADLWDLPKMAVHCRLHAQALEILRNLGTIQWSKS